MQQVRVHMDVKGKIPYDKDLPKMQGGNILMNTTECQMCGDVRHDTKNCHVKVSVVCPVCGQGTYIHASGVRACVNPFCSWIGESE